MCRFATRLQHRDFILRGNFNLVVAQFIYNGVCSAIYNLYAIELALIVALNFFFCHSL